MARGSYQLGVKLMQLGSRVSASIDTRKIALPSMEQLRDQLGEAVNLTVCEGDEVIYIERSLAKRMIRVEQIIGSRAPLYVTAVGKLMLGDQGAAACRSYAKRSKLPAYTINTHTQVAALLQDCMAAAACSYAFDNEGAELGVGCIGTLVQPAVWWWLACLFLHPSNDAAMNGSRTSWKPVCSFRKNLVIGQTSNAPSGFGVIA